MRDWFDSYLIAPPSPVSLPKLLNQRKHLVLVGAPGSGKSTLLQYLVLTFASGEQYARLQLQESRIPVHVRLRQFYCWVEQMRHEKKLHELRPAHFHEFLEQTWRKESSAPELPDGFFQRLLSQGNAIILLDGLDEVADASQRREIAILVAKALEGWRDARVIFTSRPRAWENEGRAALGDLVAEARICDLDNPQIEDFIRHWYLAATLATQGDTRSARGHAESRAVDLIGAVNAEPIRKLAATPLMLSILAMVHSRGVGLPQERSQLYYECIEFMLGYWDEIQGLDYDTELREVSRLDRQTKRQLLEPIALWMHRLGSEQVEPGQRDIEEQFTQRFLSTLNEPVDSARRHARAFLRLIVERGGLMQESEAGQFRFVHLTFQEYLAASAIAHGESPFAKVKPHLHDSWWREVILLAGGELSRQRSYRVKADTTEWLTGILNAGSWSEDVLFRDLELAFRCLSDMSPTGVDLAVSMNIARSIVKHLTTQCVWIRTCELTEMLKGLPLGHATQAIVSVISDELPVLDSAGMFKVLWVSSLLPHAALNDKIRTAYETACASMEPNLRASGAFNCVVRGSPKLRTASFLTFREAYSSLGLGLDQGRALELFALNDLEVQELARLWWREDMAGTRGYSRDFALGMLVRFGTEKDKDLALNKICRDAKCLDIGTRIHAVSLLGELGSAADAPQTAELFYGIFAGKVRKPTAEDVEAWSKIVRHRTDKIDWSPIENLYKLRDPRAVKRWDNLAKLGTGKVKKTTAKKAAPVDWRLVITAAKFVIRYADEAAQARARNFLMFLAHNTDSKTALSAFAALVEVNPGTNREKVASKLAALIPSVSDGAADWIAGTVASLGAEAWNHPELIELVIRVSEGKSDFAVWGIESLIRLLREKPADNSTVHPTVREIADRARQWMNEPDGSSLKPHAPGIMHELSTFEEFRLAAPL